MTSTRCGTRTKTHKIYTKNCVKHWAKHSSVLSGESGPFPVFSSTLGPAYNEFGYNEQTPVTSRFLCIKIIDCNFAATTSWTVITSSFFCIFYLLQVGPSVTLVQLPMASAEGCPRRRWTHRFTGTSVCASFQFFGSATEKSGQFTIHQSMLTGSWNPHSLEFFLNGVESSLNSVNSGNLINHWSMNWAQSKDPVSHMCLADAVVASWSLTKESAGSNNLF